MDILKIGLVADTSNAVKGFENTTKSLTSLTKAIAGGKDVSKDLAAALNRDLGVQSEKVASGLITRQKGLENSFKMLANARSSVLVGMGEESKLYKTLATYSDTYKEEIDKLNAAQKKQASTTKAVEVAQSSVDKTTKEVTRSYKEQTTYLQKLFSVAKNIFTFQLLMSPIRNGLKGIKDLLRESVTVAAEAEQRYNKLATVFEHFSESARQVSASLASVLGVAGSTSASALSTVGDLLQAQGMGESQSLSMSAEWVKQFQDIIAFKDINMSLEEFAQNFMSGAAGNLRNFRTIGSIVKESAVNARLAAQGLDKLTGSQLELAKMTARATIALEQQKNAMGATEREWDTMLSINRRLDEQSKRFKENMGDTINTVLKPFKQMWVEILDTINDAADASKMVKTHMENTAADNTPKQIYSLGNEDNLDLWQRVMKLNIGSFGSDLGMLQDAKTKEEIDSINADLDTIAESIIKTFAEFGLDLKTGFARITDEFSFTIQDIGDYYGVDLAGSLLSRLAPKGARLTDYLNKDDNYRILEAASDRYGALIEAISGMRVAGTPTASIWDLDYWSKSSGQTNSLLSTIAGSSRYAGNNALDNILGADLAKTWGDAVAIALDGMDKSNLLEGKANSLKTLYGIILEYMPEETDLLEKVAKAYQDTNKELADYNASIEAQKNALSAMNNIVASAAERAGVKAYTDQGYSSEVASLMYSRDLAESSVRSNWSTLYGTNAYAEIDGELRSLADVIAMATEAYDEQIKAINDAIEAERRKTFENALGTLAGGTQGYRRQLATFGMSDSEKQIQELRWAYEDLIKNLNLTGDELIELQNQYAEEEAALSTLIAEQEIAVEKKRIENLRKEFYGSINPIAQYQTAYQNGKDVIGGAAGGWIGILVELLKNTEAFSELMNIVSDTIVPILDAILKPLLPALEAVRTLFDVLPWEVITFGIKVISSTLVLILHPIKMIFAIVHNIFEWLKHPLNSGARDIISLNAIADETNALLDKIWKTTTDIERNTDKDNLALLRDLYSRGIINEDQFYAGARVVQKDMVFDPVQATNPSYIASNSPASRAISYGGFTFYITGNDPEETARATIRALREAGVDLPYNTAIGRA